MNMEKDFLDEMIAERTARNPRFPAMLAELELRRDLGRQLASRRAKARLSQTLVAARMGTAASVVSKLEAGADVKISTLQKYCAAIGQEFLPRIRPAAKRPARRAA
jgi:ribosome-binding protein aMBF1 (putative translation factor)